MTKDADLLRFIAESNRIEGITREPTDAEYEAHVAFLDKPLSVVSLVELVSVLQSDARLRNRPGRNVRVGNHVPPPGGPGIELILSGILLNASESPFADAWRTHCEYETLHPFTDGNGRSGRALWLWMMLRDDVDPYALRRGFLHTFYYQTLSHGAHRLGGDTKAVA